MDKWDRRFLELARHVSGWSKDPSTKTGAVIAHGNRLVSMGYNGFPPGADDSGVDEMPREIRLKRTVHAEVNAVILSPGPVPPGSSAYVWPWPPCAPCTAALIRAGVLRCLAPEPTAEMAARWGADFEISRRLLFESLGELVLVTPDA